jgi:thiol-disulfide isomerase/thioredoxin
MLRMLAAVACLTFGLVVSSRAGDKAKAETAEELLASSLKKAKEDSKVVFLSFGTPGCVWCKHLEKFHSREAVKKILEKHLVFVKVDLAETTGGAELYAKYSPDDAGVPVWVILSSDGKVLADSFDENKMNVGFPYEENEVKHYKKMMTEAIPKLTDKEIDTLIEELKDEGPKKE